MITDFDDFMIHQTTNPLDVAAWGAVNTYNVRGPGGVLTVANAPTVNGKSVKRTSLATWAEAVPSADCVVIVQ